MERFPAPWTCQEVGIRAIRVRLAAKHLPDSQALALRAEERLFALRHLLLPCVLPLLDHTQCVRDDDADNQHPAAHHDSSDVRKQRDDRASKDDAANNA